MTRVPDERVRLVRQHHVDCSKVLKQNGDADSLLSASWHDERIAICDELLALRARVAHLHRALARIDEVANGASSGGTEAEEIQPAVEKIVSMRARVDELEAASHPKAVPSDAEIEAATEDLLSSDYRYQCICASGPERNNSLAKRLRQERDEARDALRSLVCRAIAARTQQPAPQPTPTRQAFESAVAELELQTRRMLAAHAGGAQDIVAVFKPELDAARAHLLSFAPAQSESMAPVPPQAKPPTDAPNDPTKNVCAIRRRSDGYWWECNGEHGTGWNDKRIRQAWTHRAAHVEVERMKASGVRDDVEVVELAPKPRDEDDPKTVAALALEAVKRDITLAVREKYSNPNLPTIYCDNNGNGWRINYDEMHTLLSGRIEQARSGTWFWPKPVEPAAATPQPEATARSSYTDRAHMIANAPTEATSEDRTVDLLYLIVEMLDNALAARGGAQ